MCRLSRAVVVLLLMSGGTAAFAQDPPPVAPPPSSPAVPQASPAGAAEPPQLSLSRIRRALDETPSPVTALRVTPTAADDTPTFRVQIFAPRTPLLMPFQETLKPGWQAIVPGGIHTKEFFDMVTPPQARPFGAFQNKELFDVMVRSLESAAAQWATKKLVTAIVHEAREAHAASIRREVAQELEAVQRAWEEEQAKAAGKTTPASDSPDKPAGKDTKKKDAKKDDPKKRDDPKKNDERK